MNIRPCFPASAFNQSENREVKPGDFPVEPPNSPPDCTFSDGKTVGWINFYACWNFLLDFIFEAEAGFSWGCVSTVDSHGRTIWVADAHRRDGKRFVVRADDNLSAFELSRIRRVPQCVSYCRRLTVTMLEQAPVSWLHTRYISRARPVPAER